ncbi:MAG: hypothetical protein EDM05_57860 [Leptolyngbya sp. IPPAS B-1204]|nr:MAG: hypothetical protein EDM05_17915 [Leptolyngbya sp. IPPAS B-1204]
MNSADFQEQYTLGRRNFSGARLRQVDLRGVDLQAITAVCTTILYNSESRHLDSHETLLARLT